MNKRLLIVALLAALTLNVSAQDYPPKNTPELEFALQLKVTLGEAFGIDNTQHGPSYPSQAALSRVPY